MNQINLGATTGIDTDEVQWWYEVCADAEGRLSTTGAPNATRIMFKNGNEAILRGDAKAAFDAWAAGIEDRVVLVSDGQHLCDSCARSDDGESCTRPADEKFPECHRLKADGSGTAEKAPWDD